VIEPATDGKAAPPTSVDMLPAVHSREVVQAPVKSFEAVLLEEALHALECVGLEWAMSASGLHWRECVQAAAGEVKRLGAALDARLRDERWIQARYEGDSALRHRLIGRLEGFARGFDALAEGPDSLRELGLSVQLFGLGLYLGARIRETGGVASAQPNGVNLSEVQLLYSAIDIDPGSAARAIAKVSAELATSLPGRLLWLPFEGALATTHPEDREGPLPMIFGAVPGTTPGGLLHIEHRLLEALGAPTEAGRDRWPERAALHFGLQCGIEIRRRQHRQYEEPLVEPRRPACLYITCGYDYGQSRNVGGEFYAAQRLATHLVAFACQGAADLPWWPMHSGAQPGDLVLIHLADFTATSEDLSCEQPALAPCGYGSASECAIHNARSFMPTTNPLLIEPSADDPDSATVLPEHPAFTELRRTGEAQLGGGILAVGAITSRPAWLNGEPLTSWQANVGFIQPFPAELPLDAVAQVLPQLVTSQERGDSRYQMAEIQFEPERYTINPEQWIAFRYWLESRFSDGAEPGGGKRAVAELSQDLHRLMICSENLALGASVESLRAVAPARRYGGTHTTPVRAELHIEDDFDIERLPVCILPSGDDWRGPTPITEEGKGVNDFGFHETTLAEPISVVFEALGSDSIEALLGVLPAVLEPQIARLFDPQNVLDLWHGATLELSIRHLSLPFDPARTIVRTVWVLSLGPNRFYLALLPKGEAAAETEILAYLIEAAHRSPRTECERLLGVTSSNEARGDKISTSIEHFLSIPA
jgi:hypothetical protein